MMIEKIDFAYMPTGTSDFEEDCAEKINELISQVNKNTKAVNALQEKEKKNTEAIERILTDYEIGIKPKVYDLPERWNENIEECSDCGIKWKKIGKSCPVCYAPAEKSNPQPSETKECEHEWEGKCNKCGNDIAGNFSLIPKDKIKGMRFGELIYGAIQKREDPNHVLPAPEVTAGRKLREVSNDELEKLIQDYLKGENE